MRFVARRAFFVARVLPVAAMRFFVARTALGMLLLRLMARRLDAAECAAKFFNLALIGKLLTLGDFDQFKDFIQLVNHVLERFGNLRGVGHSLADGRSFRGAEIRRLRPLLGLLTALLMLMRVRAFRTTLMRAFAVGFTLMFAFLLTLRLRRCGSFCNRFCGRLRCRFHGSFRLWLCMRMSSVGMRNFFRRRGSRVSFGHFGVGFAEVAGGVGFSFVFRGDIMGGRFFSRFRGWRQFFSLHF
jgi:hypothetical protein